MLDVSTAMNINVNVSTLNSGSTIIETMRLRGPQIEAVRMVKGYENVDEHIFYQLKYTGKPDHSNSITVYVIHNGEENI